MSDQDAYFAVKAAELGRAFDRSFAEPPCIEQAPLEELLALRVGSDPYAIRLVEITGVFPGRAVTRLPNAVPEFLGIAGFRGNLVPVWDLGRLLGYPGGEAPRWLVIAAATPVALAFDGFDGHLRLSRTAIASEEPGAQRRPHLREVVRAVGPSAQSQEGLIRPIVGVASVLGAIKRLVKNGVAK